MDWYELLPKILNMSLTASVIIVTVLILRVLLRRAPRIYSYMLWTVVLFRLLCPITINTPLSVLGLFDPPIVETTDSVSGCIYSEQYRSYRESRSDITSSGIGQCYK